MTRFLSKLNLQGLIAQGTSVRVFTPSVSAARKALSLLLLAAKVIVQLSASSFVRVSMLVKRLIDWQFACNLLVAPLQIKQSGRLLSYLGWHGCSVRALLRTLSLICTGLLWSVALRLRLRESSRLMVDLCRSSNLAIRV
jgi:hypothetical protein